MKHQLGANIGPLGSKEKSQAAGRCFPGYGNGGPAQRTSQDVPAILAFAVLRGRRQVARERGSLTISWRLVRPLLHHLDSPTRSSNGQPEDCIIR